MRASHSPRRRAHHEETQTNKERKDGREKREGRREGSIVFAFWDTIGVKLLGLSGPRRREVREDANVEGEKG